MRFLVCALLLLAACPASPPPPVSQPPPPPTGSAPPPPVATGSCTSDADCVGSCARKSECCDQLCEPCNQVFLKAELEAHESWRAASCGTTTCPVARCMPPAARSVARCNAGACVIEQTPL